VIGDERANQVPQLVARPFADVLFGASEHGALVDGSAPGHLVDERAGSGCPAEASTPAG